MSNLIFNNQSSSPDAVGSGKSQLYSKTDGKVYAQVESGAEVAIQTGTDQVGKVLQVVESVFNLGGSYHTHTATSFVHAFSGAITPSSTSSKILIQADIMLRGAKVGSGSQDSFTGVANIDRLDPSDGSTVWQALSGDRELIQGVTYAAATSNAGHGWTIRDNTTNTFYGGSVISIMRLDSPASTDELVYDVVTRMVDQCTTLYVYDGQMIMQEIAG